MVSRLRILSANQRFDFTQIVSNGCRSNPCLTHRVADLVETDHDVASGIKARHARSLMGVDVNAALIRDASSDSYSKGGTNLRAKGRVE